MLTWLEMFIKHRTQTMPHGATCSPVLLPAKPGY